MKKKIIPFLFSLCLLAGCGKEEGCVHDFTGWDITKQATCKEAGSRERKCRKCDYVETEEVAKLDYHNFTKWEITTNPTCVVDGEKERECVACGFKETEVVPKTGKHNYVVAEDQTGAVAATCKDTGVVITECTMCHAKSTRVVPKTNDHEWGEWSEANAPTHAAEGKKRRTCSVCGAIDEAPIEKLADHTFGETPVSFASDHDLSGYDVYTCDVDNVRKIIWDANDVSPNTKNVKYNDEDNYKVDGDGVKFGGRPIGNAISLPANFMNHTSVFDETVPGAFLEYNINLKKAVPNAQLIANMKPASGLNADAGLFLSAAEGNDWTPGLIADETAESGYKITPFRYVIMVNGKEVTLDPEKNVAAADATQTGWYNFPCTVDLKAGVNTIKLIQAGGWEATFYNFGVISAEGVEDVVADAAQGFTVQVTGDANVTGIQFFEDKACTVEDNAETHYSRNDMGRMLNDGEGQVSFAVSVADGYEVKEVRQVSPESKAYKNIKNPLDTAQDNGRNDVYRITKIEADCEFEIVTQEVGGQVYVGFEYTFVLGDHITGIEIYNSKTCNPDTLVAGLVATSIDKSTLKPTQEVDNAQIYLKIFCEEGFVVDTAATTWSVDNGETWTTDNKPFNKFEAESDGGDNAYKFTKVNASVMIKLVGKAA